jgi:hypothetical protein
MREQEAGSRKQEAGSRKQEAGSRKQDARCRIRLGTKHATRKYATRIHEFNLERGTLTCNLQPATRYTEVLR